MLRLSTQLHLRLLALVAVSFCLATWTLWKGETMRAEKDVRTLLEINYRDVSRGFADRADFQLVSIAREIANRLGSSGKLASEDVAALCAEEEIAEIYDVDARGIVVGGSRLVGEKVHGEQWSEFLVLLEPDGPESMSQPDRPRTSDGKVFKYAAALFPDKSGYIEVGWSEERFLRFLRQRAYGYTRSWHIDERGYIVFVDRNGVVTSHTDMSLAGKTLQEATGLDPATVPTGTLFRATLAGEPMFCYAGPVRDYLAVLADPVEDAFASRDRFMPRIAVVQLAVFALLFAFVSRMLRVRVAGSVRRIGSALRRIAGGDLAGRADERTCLEFSELSDNINATVDALRSASEDRVRHIEAELELGRTIQQAALPADFPSEDGWRLAASMEAAREVGGDFYDFFPVGETHRAFLVADVSGKGVTGALYMMNAKTLLKDALLAEPAHDPAEALSRANAELCANNPAEMFVTAWVGVLDLDTGRVAFANAGHNPPLRLHDGAAPEWIREKSGCPLGCFEGVSYKRRELALDAGDALFLYTDGVTEAMDGAGALFGEDRLAATLAAADSREPRA
ncbi:MAG: SpoIIE family protein phosphatase, partial [Kiritimatiellae bacterium]|nr:SpoIIE family protein phosphatase [Kiritimatiellia bacterium]